MECKYVMFEVKAPVRRAIPFLFFEPVTHLDMYLAIRDSDAAPLDARLRSAGFFNDMKGITFGESESLLNHAKVTCDLKPEQCVSREEDAALILQMKYGHGVIEG